MRALILFFCLIASAFAETKNMRWKILNETWTDDFELSYQNFIHTMGVARRNGVCQTTDECLRSPIANPMYADKNPSKLINVYSDCADLPYVLRAYFAWMNDLPFSYPTDLVEAKNFTRNKGDIRYSKYGNIITEKRYIRNGDNINKILQDVPETISTASFRTNAGLYDTGDLFRDTYPVDIDKRAITPGTIVYDPNGHVAIVYEVTKSGQVHLMDAHPDNSLTTITYGEKFARSSVRIGSGFSNFRPFSVANRNISPRSNSELPYYSLIQFQTDPFILDGKVVTFYEYVRGKLADGDVVYDPIKEFGDYLDELCLDTKYREQSVNLAVNAGIDQQSHPYMLPANIYGADGDWETYATPSRDARLKALTREIKEYLTKVIHGYTKKNIKIIFDGDDLVHDLREKYFAKTKACTVMADANTTINLDTVLINLFALSFDPYHCSLMRWGMKCETDANKQQWYDAEQGLRNRVDRDYSLKTDYNVDDLPNAPASQVEKPDLGFDELLQIPRTVDGWELGVAR
jgi:hypothetical protein